MKELIYLSFYEELSDTHINDQLQIMFWSGKVLEEVYLVDFLRTPFTRFTRKEPQKDPFYNLRPEEIASLVINKLIEKKWNKS